ncbi:Peroxiredoxin [Singulisphaera sp. GP187]|uniref:DUF2092 domain-containing protein n=1 Tax=Singulisphaera sp. GP187 TaxID=1882752 RepID=UPI00092CAE7F|nr:DUF2092 domain-containing protein [Singulisphaera sp. GP187]SIO58281.1 Peroxiredoxin [Singulisphaera sp. GP187]
MFSSCFAVLGLVVLAQTPKTEDSPFKPLTEAKRIDPRFDEVLTASQTVMRNAKTFRVLVKMITKSTVAGEAAPDTVVTHTLTARRPDSVAIESETVVDDVRKPVLRAVCDGRSLVTLYDLEPKVYSRYEGPNPAGQIARTLIIPKVLEGSGLEILTRHDMRDHILRETTEAKLVGPEEVDGIATEHFRVDWHGAVLDLWIGPKDQPLERKMTSTRVTPLSGGKESTVVREARYAWTIDQPIPDQVFRAEVPAEARRVEDVFETLFYQESAELVGKPAPATALKVLDGNEVNLASLKGQPVVLVFWASWSSDSLAVLPPLAELAPQCKERGVALYTVSVGEDAEDARKALASSKLRLPVPVLLDPKDLTAASFGIRRLPTTVVIGPDGIVRAITRETKELPVVRAALEGLPPLPNDQTK